jgi:hypothetical protein
MTISGPGDMKEGEKRGRKHEKNKPLNELSSVGQFIKEKERTSSFGEFV